jgi:hypothetical protein
LYCILIYKADDGYKKEARTWHGINDALWKKDMRNKYGLTALQICFRCTTGPYRNSLWFSPKGSARSYDVFLDEVLDVVEVTSLGNCVVVVAVRKLLPDFRL